jgi:hypothetical protein
MYTVGEIVETQVSMGGGSMDAMSNVISRVTYVSPVDEARSQSANEIIYENYVYVCMNYWDYYYDTLYRYLLASFLPFSTSTLIRMGTASQIMNTRKKNA